MDNKFITKDSWQREEFSTWSKRDVSTWKPRYDLISHYALKRIAMLLWRGAEKYGERNWELWQPTDRLLESWLRHLYQYIEWDTSEDHLSAVCFNVMAIMHFQEENDRWQLNSLLKNKADVLFLKENSNEDATANWWNF